MITIVQALSQDEFHYGKCVRNIGPRGGITEKIEKWRRNGKTQIWKRSPDRFRIPIKFGMYAYSQITEDMTQNWHCAEDCPLNEPHKDFRNDQDLAEGIE